MNGSELRSEFLQNASAVVKSVTDSGQGLKDNVIDFDNPDFNPDNYSKTWDLARDIILASADAIKIEARSTEGIINSVCNGNITIPEAKELIAMLQMKQNMDELPELLLKLEELEE